MRRDAASTGCRIGSIITDRLLPLVYNELRQLASAKLAAERPGQTLNATALVHEAYLRLAGQKVLRHDEDRAVYDRFQSRTG